MLMSTPDAGNRPADYTGAMPAARLRPALFAVSVSLLLAVRFVEYIAGFVAMSIFVATGLVTVAMWWASAKRREVRLRREAD